MKATADSTIRDVATSSQDDADMRASTLTWALTVLAFGSAAMAEEVTTVPVVRDAASSRELISKARKAEKVYLADLARGKEGGLLKGDWQARLQPGRYRFHCLLALAPRDDPRVSAAVVRVQVGTTTEMLTADHFEGSEDLREFTLDFVSRGEGPEAVTIQWSYAKTEEAQRALKKASAKEASKVKVPMQDIDSDVPGDLEDASDRELIDTDGMVSLEEASRFAVRLVGCGFHFEPLCPVVIESVSTDKAVYKPNEEAGRAELVLRNHGNKDAAVALSVELHSGLDKSREIHAGTIEVPPRGTAEWKGTFTLAGVRWGAEIRASATVEGWEPSLAREAFCVTDNFWNVAVVAPNGQSIKYSSHERAEATVGNLRRSGFNAQEFFFWAPDDFGDFTPDTDPHFGSQGAYRESAQGTKWCIDACHQAGISSVVYANLWGGGGPNAFELMRKHPDWFGQASFNVALMDDWELLPRGKVRAPSNVWLYTNVNVENTYDAFKVHAAEVIAGHRMLGWDGTRYDSWNTEAWVKKAFAVVRGIVEKEIPNYRWAFNSFTERDRNRQALGIMVGGGGLIMDEGIRSMTAEGGKLAALAHRILWQRDTIWPHGGHLGVICGVPGNPHDASCSAAVIFACGAHPYYAAPEGTRFALRYSEFIWDNRMRPIKNPEQVIKLGRDGHFLKWRYLARTLRLDGDQRRLVVHLINAPKGYILGRRPQVPFAPPVTGLPVELNLPTDAVIEGAWALYFPGSHAPLALKREDKSVTVTVPEVRYWTAIVVDYESKSALEVNTAMPSPNQEW